MRWRLGFLTLTACNAILSNDDRVLRTGDDASPPDRPDATTTTDGGSVEGAVDAPVTPDGDATSGGVEVLVTGLTGPQQVFVVAGKLYWSHGNGLGWCDLPACAVKKPFHTNNDPGPWGLAVDANGILVGSTNNDFVYTYPLGYDGTGQSLIANGLDTAGVALDGNTAFFTTSDGSLYRCNRSGCGGSPALVSKGTAPGGAVTVGTTKAIWASLRVPDAGPSSGVLQQVDKTATEGTAFAASYGRGPRTLLMLGTKLHWTATEGPANYDGEVSKRDNGLDSLSEEFYAQQQKEPWGLAVDATHVYFTVATAGGTVRRCPLNGPFPSTPQDVATGQGVPHGVAVDATHVYWANFGDGTISRAPKP